MTPSPHLMHQPIPRLACAAKACELLVDPRLNDIRILKLAEMYERAYEGFVLEMAERYVWDPDIRGRVARLVAPADRHAERIAAELGRLSALADDADRAAFERAALRDVVEVERSARSFYLRYMDDLEDEGARKLFRELAKEESAHVRIAEDALALDERRRQASPDAETERMLRLMEETPIWEGTSDISSRS